MGFSEIYGNGWLAGLGFGVWGLKWREIVRFDSIRFDGLELGLGWFVCCMDGSIAQGCVVWCVVCGIGCLFISVVYYLFVCLRIDEMSHSHSHLWC